MTNVKFVANNVVVNNDVDMDVELVRDMLKSEAGIEELYSTAQKFAGPVHVVDEDTKLAEGVATMLNEAYKEFLSKDKVRQQAATKVNTAFEGTSRVPTAESAEDAAFANMENKSNQTKNEKVETKMTNNNETKTQGQINAESDVARKFLDQMGSKIQDANKGPVQPKKEEAKKESKPSVKVNTESTKNEKEVANMNNTVNVKGNKESVGRENVGGTTSVKVNTKKAVTNSFRVNFDESSNAFNKFEGPWYLNAGLHPEVEFAEELVAMRKLEQFGIKDIRFVDPSTVLRYDNHNILSIVEVTTEGKKGDNVWSIRIKEEDRQGKTADLKSSNIGWDTVNGDLRPVYQYFKKNEENVVTAACACGARHSVALNTTAGCECGKGVVANLDSEGTVTVYYVDAKTLEFTEAKEGSYSIPNYTPVVRHEVAKEVCVLALAFAQYAHGLDMHGVVEED